MILRWISAVQKSPSSQSKLRVSAPVILFGAISLLFSGTILSAQTTPQPTNSSSTDPNENGSNSLSIIGRHTQGIEILSDTQGADFSPYMKKLQQIESKSWNRYLTQDPDVTAGNAGWTTIRFTISADGRVTAMRLEGSSHVEALNRAAWAAITSVGNFPALPHGFSSPNLELRIRFNVSDGDGK